MATIIIENKLNDTISNYNPFDFLREIIEGSVPEIFKVLSVSRNFNEEFVEEFRATDDDVYYSWDFSPFLENHSYAIYDLQNWDIGLGNNELRVRLANNIEEAKKILDYLQGVR